MADPKDSGFNIPAPQDSPSPAASDATVPAPGLTGIPQLPPRADTSSRDLMFAGGALLVFIVVFFIARNAYANMLVSHRVSPRSANAAGWWLYILLLSLATAGVLGVMDHVKYLTLVYVLPLSLVAVVSLILTAICSRRAN